MTKDTLRKRYVFKLGTNLFNMMMGLLTAGIVPRALGPVNYGNYSFLQSFFQQTINFLDMGTSIGFYAKLSKAQKDHGLVVFYSYFVLLLAGALALFLLVALSSPLAKNIWPNQQAGFIMLSAGLCVLMWLSQVFDKMTDAYGLTVPAEIAKSVRTAIATFSLVMLFIYSSINLFNYFIYQYLLTLILITTAVVIIFKNGRLVGIKWGLSRAKFMDYSQAFYKYSSPLFFYALIGMLVAILDRWILQFFGGSSQQGFYSLSYSIGAYCFVFTSSMQPLLMREFSIAHGENDLAKMATMFRKYIPLFYSIAACLSCYVAVQADKIVMIFGGNNYQAAIVPVAIMAFYPVHQTYGTLSASVFFATGQTTLYRNIGIFYMLLGVILTYFLIAPGRYYGLDAGAVGLGIKMIIFQFFVVNTQLFFNAKYLNLNFWKYLAHQVICLIMLTIIALIAKNGVDAVYGNNGLIIIRFLAAGIVYTALALTLAYTAPAIFGLDRASVKMMHEGVIKRFRGGWR